MTKRLNCLLAAITLFFLSNPAQSEWFANVPPKPGATAVETAGAAPADSSFVVAWNLEGQVDVMDYLSKIEKVVQAENPQNDVFAEIESELGRSPAQILSYFSGAGFVSLREGSDRAGDPQLILALAVKDHQGLSLWLDEMFRGETVAKRDGFHLFLTDEDDAILGLDRQWMFFGLGEGAQPYALGTFKGEQGSMNSQPRFRRAFAELGYRQSGVAAFMNKGLYASLLSISSRMFGMNANSSLPIWEYGAGAIDFQAETGDLFLKLSGDSQAAKALGQAGGLKSSLIKKVPSDLSAYIAVDTAWYANILETVSGEHPPLEMMYQYARAALNELGDLEDAFAGPVVVGSDIFDRLRPDSPPPTVVGIAEVDNVHEAHRISLKATASEMIDHPADPQIYNSTPKDFSLRLDSTAEELRFVWGPRSDEFLQRAPNRSNSAHPLVKETLKWSKDDLAILTFFDLENIVAHWRKADAPSGDERVAREFVRQFLNHSRLQGVMAVRSNSQGIHYKIRGLATSPLIPASFLGGIGFWTLVDSGNSAAEKAVSQPKAEPAAK